MSDVLAELDAWLDRYHASREAPEYVYADMELTLAKRARDEIVALRKERDSYAQVATTLSTENGVQEMVVAAGIASRTAALEEAAQMMEDTWSTYGWSGDLADTIRALKDRT